MKIVEYQNKTPLKTHTICLLLLAIIPVTKIISMPSFSAYYSSNSLWISAVFCFILDLVLIITMLYACNKFKCSFYDSLVTTFNKTTANIIMIFLAIYFIIKGIFPIIEEKYFIEITFYDELSSNLIFYPFFILLIYLCYKGIKIYERTSAFLFVITIIGIIIILFLSVKETVLDRLKPLFEVKIDSVIKGSFSNLLFCGEGIYLLFFLGRKKNNNKLITPMIFSLIPVYMSIIAIFICFYGVFGEVSITKVFSISQMSHYSLLLSEVGRVDSFATFLIDFVRFFALGLPFVCSVECFRYVFGENTKLTFIISLIVVCIPFLISLLFDNKLIYLYNTINKYFGVPLFIITYILPLFVLLLKKEKNEKLFK